MLQGIIFDFDGIILETEGAIFQAYQELYRAHGQALSLADWAHVIGISPDEYDPLDDLARLIGPDFPREKAEETLRLREKDLIAEKPVQPGVQDYLDEAVQRSYKLAIASSSSHSWVDRHLKRLGLYSYFDAICCSDDVENAKPDPALYQLALQRLNLGADQAFVLEDSPNGALAAKRAGLFCVAVPTDLTGQLTFEHADLLIESLAEVSLEELLTRINHT